MGCGASGPSEAHAVVPQPAAAGGDKKEAPTPTKPKKSVTGIVAAVGAKVSGMADGDGGKARGAKKKDRIVRSGKKDANDEGQVKDTSESKISAQDQRWLERTLREHFLFKSLEHNELAIVVAQMYKEEFQPEQNVFKQGDDGNACYVISGGSFHVTINDKSIRALSRGMVFGELAMLYSVARTGTVACGAEVSTVWVIPGNSFRHAMTQVASKHASQVTSFFTKHRKFSSLREAQLRLLCTSATIHEFRAAEEILRAGESGEWLFIVMAGGVRVTDSYGNEKLLREGDVVGEYGVIYRKNQLATAVAVDAVKCLAIGRAALDRIVGSAESLFRRGAIRQLLESPMSKVSEWFGQLTDNQQDTVTDTMDDGSFEPGEAIVRQGAPAQLLLVVSGTAEVSTTPDSHPEVQGVELSTGMSFGGDACCDGTPMPEYLLAKSAVTVHRMALGDFLGKLEQETKVSYGSVQDVVRKNTTMQAMLDIFLFKTLNENQLNQVLANLERVEYKPGQPVVTEGESSDHFYLIESGHVSVTVDKGKKEVRQLRNGEYFGERGLLMQEVRTASCLALTDTVIQRLEASIFLRIVGAFRSVLERRIQLQDMKIELGHLNAIAIVGEGTFGTVKKVVHKDFPDREYALKAIKRKCVLEMEQFTALQVEHKVLKELFHPCVVQFIKAFKDDLNIYFLTEFLGGGDLFYAIRELGLLTRPQSQFYGASIIMAIDHVHQRGFTYRDLKPENIILDTGGYAKMVDFGCCGDIKAISTTLVGTPEYIAPEVIVGKGYSGLVDWWSMGVVMYEFICGPLPFQGGSGEDQLELFRDILQGPLKFPKYIQDADAISLLTQFLDRTPELRLGSSKRGVNEVKEHAYFRGYDWDAICARTVKPPWEPDMSAITEEWSPCEGVVDAIDPAEIAELRAVEAKVGAIDPKVANWDANF